LDPELRRTALLNVLGQSAVPVTGADLSGRFGVSRQVIVQDIAILRARGEQVLATPQGYMFPGRQERAVRGMVACRHSREAIEQELGIIVDLGGRVLDVIVEHPLYGELCGTLMIASRRDLSLYLARLGQTKARPLSALTGGVHLHTIEVSDSAALAEIVASLRQAGFLID